MQSEKIPNGIKIIIGFHIISTVLWIIGQTFAIFYYDTVAAWGLQELRVFNDPVIIEVNRGIALADSIIMIPLFIPAVIGLWRLKFFGAVFSWMVLSINIYWPVEALSTKYFFSESGIKHVAFDIGTIIFLAIIVLFSGWACAYLLSKRKLFI